MAFFKGLGKLRDYFSGKIASLAGRMAKGEEEVYSELEEFLIYADLGPEPAGKLVEELRRGVGRRGPVTESTVKERLAELLIRLLPEGTDEEGTAGRATTVILMVGPHGVGKTTTVARLAAYHAAQGRSVVVGAADTYRAAAVDQLRVWCDRIRARGGVVECVAQGEGADPAAVAFDAVAHGRAGPFDRVIVDTAGRIHSRAPLMDSLQKVRRSISKALADAPHETLLVLDATVGQNALAVGRSFASAAPLTGLILTKVDGTAKGGILFSLSSELRVPVGFLGTGEGLDDFEPFEARRFVRGMLGLE